MTIIAIKYGLKYFMKDNFWFLVLCCGQQTSSYVEVVKIWNNTKSKHKNEPLGAVHKLSQDFGFFWPPTSLHWHFLWYKCWQKVDIFGPPTYLVL